MINLARLAAFSDAYVVAIMAAVEKMKPYMGSQTPEDFAVAAAVLMIERIQAVNVEAVAKYGLNDEGGALKATADALGVSVSGLQGYLEGK